MNQTSQPPVLQTFNVHGMTCGHCEKAVTRAVKQLDPQADVKIDRAANKVLGLLHAGPCGAFKGDC